MPQRRNSAVMHRKGKRQRREVRDTAHLFIVETHLTCAVSPLASARRLAQRSSHLFSARSTTTWTIVFAQLIGTPDALTGFRGI
jgi:hypothetical protein